MVQTTAYETNDLNQHRRTSTTGGNRPAVQHITYDVDGNLDQAYVAADMNRDGIVNGQDIDGFVAALFGG